MKPFFDVTALGMASVESGGVEGVVLSKHDDDLKLNNKMKK